MPLFFAAAVSDTASSPRMIMRRISSLSSIISKMPTRPMCPVPKQELAARPAQALDGFAVGRDRAPSGLPAILADGPHQTLREYRHQR